MGTNELQHAGPAGRSKTDEAPYQERIAHFVLDDWMSIQAGREPSRSYPTSKGVRIPPEVTSLTELGTGHQQQFADVVGTSGRLFEVKMNDGGVTATAIVAQLTRDDRLELLQAYCDWPFEGQKRELNAQHQLTLA